MYIHFVVNSCWNELDIVCRATGQWICCTWILFIPGCSVGIYETVVLLYVDIVHMLYWTAQLYRHSDYLNIDILFHRKERFWTLN